MSSKRPVSTYSIVARDRETGEMGVAVQSHWFSVGTIVTWAEAGVGAVATQSLVDPAYGPLGLALMKTGKNAAQALTSILAGDEGRDVRQVAMIDSGGNVDAHTGENCIQSAGHITDADQQFSVQANMMTDETIWPAMADAYRSASGDLAERMLAALDAAEAAGGDIRGRQSAAILIVKGQSTGKAWADARFDLRVEDHPNPLDELRRLVQLQRAYQHMNAGDASIEEKNFDAARASYAAAEQLAPNIMEIPFWHAVTLVSSGNLKEALPIFARVFEREPVWRDLVPRLVDAGILPDDAEALAQILD